jgi:serine/threonine protein kinase
MMRLSDSAVARLRELTDLPDPGSARYEIIERLAEGGMGVVYRAHDRALQRDVALKVVHPAAAGHDDAARLRREARTIAGLAHPGIVPLYDAGVLTDGRMYYTMKLVRGDRLDLRARKTASLEQIIRVMQRVIEAVAFAHAQGVLHRDLKPANIMVGEFGEVLVMDWGVAISLRAPTDTGMPATAPDDAEHDSPWMGSNRDSVVTAHGTVIGTPGFMPPEQAAGDVASLDERSDVYALGAILRALVQEWAGAAPGRRAPARLTAIADRAMASAPAARYGSVSAMADDIAAFLAGDRVGAYHEGPIEHVMRFADRYRTPILLVLAYLIMRLALLLWMQR